MTKRNLKLIFEKIAFEYGFKKHRYMYIKEYIGKNCGVTKLRWRLL